MSQNDNINILPVVKDGAGLNLPPTVAVHVLDGSNSQAALKANAGAGDSPGFPNAPIINSDLASGRTDFPYVAPTAVLPAGGAKINVKAGNVGVTLPNVRFSNPS